MLCWPENGLMAWRALRVESLPDVQAVQWLMSNGQYIRSVRVLTGSSCECA